MNTDNCTNIHSKFHTNTTIHANIGSNMENRISLKNNANTNSILNTHTDNTIITHSNIFMNTDLSSGMTTDKIAHIAELIDL